MTGTSESYAERFVLNLIEDIDTNDLAEFVGSRVDFKISAASFDDLVDSVYDAVKRITISFKES